LGCPEFIRYGGMDSVGGASYIGIEQTFDYGRVVGVIPAELDRMEPGPILGAFLSTIKVGELSGFERVVVLRAHLRMASHYQAQVYEAMASISDLMSETDQDPELAAEAAAVEVRVALRLTRRAADSELALAVDLKRRLPQVWEALAAGRIDLRRARIIVFGTSHLSDDAAREVVDRIIDRAPRLTTGQLAALLRRVCVIVDPQDAAARYREALSERRVIMEETEAGTANLFGLDLPPERVTAALGWISDMARSLNTASETRTMDQLRADILLDLLEGKGHQNRSGKGVVDIQVDLQTLAGLSEAPGELAGFGPVIADIARQVTDQQHQTEWRWTVTHPDTGLPVHQGISRRRPSREQRRQVESRHPTCVFPGCRMPASDCDLDHRIPWSEDGPTRVENLAPLCRHDHRIRHETGWKHQPLPGGDHQWTSPLGHIYTTSGQPP